MHKILTIGNQDVKVPVEYHDEMKSEIDGLVCIGNLGIGMIYKTSHAYKRDNTFNVRIFIEKEDEPDDIWYQLYFLVNANRILYRVDYFSYSFDTSKDIVETANFVKPIKRMREMIFSHE